jgi:hypothetical protein
MIVVILSTQHPQADLFRRPYLPCRVPRLYQMPVLKARIRKGAK